MASQRETPRGRPGRRPKQSAELPFAPKTYDLVATLGQKTEVHSDCLLGQVELFIDALIQEGWDVAVMECATGVVVPRKEVARRWADLDPADIA